MAQDVLSRRQWPEIRAALTVLVLTLDLVLAACAPDAWRPDRHYEDFLDQVQRQCGYDRIGSRAIGSDLLQDAYFLDVTSRFFHREIGPDNYASAIAGSFDGAVDNAGIRCILNIAPR